MLVRIFSKRRTRRHTDLESEWEPPRNRSFSERKAKREPIRYRETSYAISHLNDDKLSTASHFACFGLPDTRRCSIHPCSEPSNDTANNHLGNTVGGCLNDSTECNGRAAEENCSRAT